TGLTTLGEAGVLDPENGLVEALIFLGNSPIALLISVVVATIVLGNLRGEQGSVLEKVLDSALGPISSVVLITGAGGMFGGVLQETGIGDALAETRTDRRLPVIGAAYVTPVILRLPQPSAPAALVTAAGLAAPAVAAGSYNELQIVAI